jgi:cation diffusion facilitator family transporter
MADHGSKKVIVLALGANFGIACAKLVAFLMTASASMLAEAVHSLADTGNQLLLLLGMKRAAKPPDDRHPFGYKLESYFWSFIVAILLFTLGGCFAIYEGFEKLHEIDAALRAGEDVTMQSPHVAIGVLLVSIALEGWSWIAATREVNRLRGETGLFRFVEESKSTEIIVIWMEDTGALVGLFFALLGVTLVLVTKNPYWDVWFTFAIGVLLVVIAFAVARETKSLMIGEGASQSVLDDIAKVVGSHEGVERLVTMRTLHLGEDELVVAIKVHWRGDLTANEVSRHTNALEERVREAVPLARYLFVEPDVYDPTRG